MRRSRSGRSRSGQARSRRAGATLSLLALGFSGLLSALSLVTWRQSRAFEAMAELARLERSLSLAESERTELIRRIQSLASWPRIPPAHWPAGPRQRGEPILGARPVLPVLPVFRNGCDLSACHIPISDGDVRDGL